MALVPVLGSFLILLLPAPLGYQRVKGGATSSAAAALLCAAVAAFFGGAGMALFAATLAISGFVQCGSLLRGERDDLAIIRGTIVPLIVVGAGLGAYFLAARTDPWALLDKNLAEGVKQTLALYRQMGLREEDIAALTPTLTLMSRLVSDYLPALCVSGMASTSYMNWLIIRRYSEKAGLVPPREAKLAMWAAPDYAIWGVIIPGFLMIPPEPVLRQMAGNLLAVFGMVYLFQGLAIAAHLSERLRLSALVKAVCFLIMLLQPYLAAAIFAAGLFDTWADFRKIRKKPAGGAGVA